MNTKRLHNIIQDLKSSGSINSAYFGYYQYGGGTDESMIKANKDGLMLYAATLLEAAAEVDVRSFESQLETFRLNDDWISENSEFYFSFVELYQQTKDEIEPPIEHIETFPEMSIRYLIISILIFILISILVGIGTILSWLF